MKIAIASGKGGTGKTLVSVSLALSVAEVSQVTLLDCDVEEPNSHLLLSLDEAEVSEAMSPSFTVNKEKCTACGDCARVCRFNAVASLKTVPMFFPELCHGCGGCVVACPANAIIESTRQIGKITKAICNKETLGNLTFISGTLNIGEAMAAPLVKKVKEQITNNEEVVIIDSPPGASCSMIAAIDQCDYVVLVTEPTPFGLSDLKKAVATVREKNIPFGVIINRAEDDVRLIDSYCTTEGIDILLRIPFDMKIAKGYSIGESLASSMPYMKYELNSMLGRIRKYVS